MRFPKQVGWGMGGMAIGFVVCLILNEDAGGHVKSWAQPSGVKYDENDPYRADLCEGARIWRPFDHRKQEHRLWVGPNGNPPCEGYGHKVLWRFADDGKNYLAKVDLTWTAEGVEMFEPDGHRVFVPRKAFIGGR